MSCCLRVAPRAAAPRAGALLQATSTTLGAADADVIMGTWDYKWPLGSVIRVAFQRPAGFTPEDFQAARAAVQAIAERWHDDKAAIRFDFSTPDFDVPATRGEKVHPRQRSDNLGGSWREYDVLVSLAPLPLTLEDTITEENPFQDVFLPLSQLGTYARRIDYGTPTLFVGPMHQNFESLAAYYSEPLAQNMVLHEFGHALGLAHEHQNPILRKKLGLEEGDYDLAKARELLITRLGVPEAKLPPLNPADPADPTTLFLRSHLELSWPGNPRFSDWRTDSDTFESVMTVPYHACALKPEAAERLKIESCDCGADSCDSYKAALFDRPTSADRAFLAEMYPAPSQAGTAP